MINSIGDISLFISFILAGFSLFVFICSYINKSDILVDVGQRFLLSSFFSLTVSIVCLFVLLIIKDYSNLYVVKNVSNDLSPLFSATSLWAGQAGSLLLWAWILSLYVLISVPKSLKKILPASKIAGGFVLVFFLYLISFVESPFETTSEQITNGRGLNPILQNIYMSIHPLSLYLGYISLTIPFSFGLGALISKDGSSDWIKLSKKWTYFSWTFLSIGLLLGSRWAYLELGWGGYWAWDPVENVALMPWLLLTAFLHSSYAQEEKNVLKRWNLLLIFLAFFLSIFGTFITRSGLISSVHSFAQSSIGDYFIIFIIFLLIFSLSFYFKNKNSFYSVAEIKTLSSKENFFVINNILFLVITITVLLGTVFPIISEFITGEKILVGPSFYNIVNFPNILLLLLLMSIAPFLPWSDGKIKPVVKYLSVPFAIAIIFAIIFYSFYKSYQLFLVNLLCLTVLLSLFKEFIKDLRLIKKNKNILALKYRRYCSFIVHVGIVLLIMGVSFSSYFEEKYDLTLANNQSKNIGTFNVKLLNTYKKETDSKFILGANVLIKDRNKEYKLNPEQNLYKYEGNREINKETEVSIHSTFFRDYYLILVDENVDGAFNFKIYINPLVSLLWIGSFISIIGGFLSIFRGRLTND
mgnify:FL=1